MRVGIIGDARRAVAWENHLRPLNIVNEVVIAPTLEDIGQVQACILLDETSENLHLLIECIRQGLHTYLVSTLPVDKELLEKVYHTSEEAEVRVQFSHWPSISSSTQWMIRQIPKPRFIQVIREKSHLHFTDNRENFHHHWIDEVALVTKWMAIQAHRVEPFALTLQQAEAGIQIYLKYESGATASIFYLASGTEDRHRRLVNDKNLSVDLNVSDQTARLMKSNDQGGLVIEKKTFDPSKTAELSAIQFFKSVQLKKETIFTPYDALKTADTVQKIRKHLGKP
ncbi:MAG: hypothetical protein WD599_01875 [Balneolaceae bacterium]